MKKLAFIFWFLFYSFLAAEVRPVYTVGIEEINYFPVYSAIKNNPGSFRGYYRELLDLFAKEEGIQFRYHAFPVKRLFRKFLDEELDFKNPASPKWQKSLKQNSNKTVFYSQKTLTFDNVLLVPRGDSPAKRQVWTLGFIRGFTPWMFKDQIKIGTIKLQESHSPEALLNMVLLSRVDGIEIPRSVANYHLKRMDKEGLLVHEPSILKSYKGTYYFATIKYPVLMKKFDQFLVSHAELLENIKERYGLKGR